MILTRTRRVAHVLIDRLCGMPEEDQETITQKICHYIMDKALSGHFPFFKEAAGSEAAGRSSAKLPGQTDCRSPYCRWTCR
jgi:hypothetical protein